MNDGNKQGFITLFKIEMTEIIGKMRVDCAEGMLL